MWQESVICLPLVLAIVMVREMIQLFHRLNLLEEYILDESTTTIVEDSEPKNRLDELLGDNAAQPNAKPTLMKEAIVDRGERHLVQGKSL